LQEIKAHYCIAQQNSLIIFVNLINTSTYSKFADFKRNRSWNYFTNSPYQAG